MAEFSLVSLNYTVNLRETYQQLKDLPGFALLESSDNRYGRYDIVTAYPYDEIVVSAEQMNKAFIFDEIQKKLKVHQSPLNLPFQGGAIGFFSYDLACHLAGIHLSKNPVNLPLAIIRFYDWAIITDHQQKKVTLFAANHQKETRNLIKEIMKVWETKSLVAHSHVKENFTPLISREEYGDAFNQLKQFLQAGRCYQVNLTQPFLTKYQGDSWWIYNKIATNNPVPYAAFLRYKQADILSFSPERFILQEQHKILTSPIKGSIKRSVDVNLDGQLKLALYHSLKNRAENVMIVDLLRNDFGKIAKPGSVKVEALWSVESYRNIHHLVSHITAETMCPSTEVFKACFPGGSITGAPKLEAMKVIAELERQPRGVYCGSIAYFSHHGRFDSNIAIRTIVADHHHLHLAAGGGIVIDSDENDEYQECFTKIKAIMKGLFL